MSRFGRTSAMVPIVAAVVSVSGCGQAGSAAAQNPGAASPVPAGVANEYTQVNEEIRNEGGETTVGEWRIGYIVEPAEAWHQVMNGNRSYREPVAGETHHIEIVPFEASSGRIVPDVPIHLEVVDGTGAVVDAKQLTFYHAEFFHYANNFSVPANGRYTLRARVEPPSFPRHGEHHEQPPLADGTTVEFRDVELTS